MNIFYLQSPTVWEDGHEPDGGFEVEHIFVNIPVLWKKQIPPIWWFLSCFWLTNLWQILCVFQMFWLNPLLQTMITLPETNIAHENPIFPCKYHQNISKWWIFHGYVSFRDGRNDGLNLLISYPPGNRSSISHLEKAGKSSTQKCVKEQGGHLPLRNGVISYNSYKWPYK